MCPKGLPSLHYSAIDMQAWHLDVKAPEIGVPSLFEVKNVFFSAILRIFLRRDFLMFPRLIFEANGPQQG